jgi:hypothetical protein
MPGPSAAASLAGVQNEGFHPTASGLQALGSGRRGIARAWAGLHRCSLSAPSAIIEVVQNRLPERRDCEGS